MDAALATSALLMGLAGGPHCAAMCGAAYGALGAAPGGALARVRATLALHGGRLAGYSAAGALVAATLGGLGALQAAAPVVRPLWTLVHVAAIALGVWLAWNARAPAWLSGANGRAARLLEARPIRLFRSVPPAPRAALAGACWAAVPCGLLQSALLVAALASSPAQGALVMACFASASALSLWAAPALWQRLRGRDATHAAIAIRLAGVVLALSSLFALWHGLGAAIAAICGIPA